MQSLKSRRKERLYAVSLQAFMFEAPMLRLA